MANEYYKKDPDGLCSECIKVVRELPTDLDLANKRSSLDIPFTLSPSDMHKVAMDFVTNDKEAIKFKSSMCGTC